MSVADISDRRVNQRWFAVFQEIVTAGEIGVLGPTAFCVYCVIKSRAHRETGRARIFLADIARLIGRKDDAVIRALKVLKQHGVSAEIIQAGARIGAVMTAVATVHSALN